MFGTVYLYGGPMSHPLRYLLSSSPISCRPFTNQSPPFTDRSPTYSRTAHNLTGGVFVWSHCYLLMRMCILAVRGCHLSCDMAKYEESVLGKLSGNLQQQAELLKHLCKQKSSKKSSERLETEGKYSLKTNVHTQLTDEVLAKAKQIGKRLSNNSNPHCSKKPKMYEDVEIIGMHE